MSDGLDDFSRVVGQVYEASLDDGAWIPALEAICGFVGASKAVLGEYLVRERAYDLEIFAGYEPHWIELYHTRYGALNPLKEAPVGQGVGEIRCISQYGLVDAFRGDPMYEEWVRPQGILDIAEIVLDRSLTHAATLALTRVETEGVFTAEAIRRFELVFPHVRRSLLIGRVLRMHRRAADEVSAVIDGLVAGVFLVGRRGEILRVNAAGDGLLASGVASRDAGGRLRFGDADADRVLAEALRESVAGSTPPFAGGGSVPLAGPDGARYVANVLPLSSDRAAESLGVPPSTAAVFVSPANPDLGRALDALSAAHSLTAAETRVARAVVEVGATPMIAEALGVSVATVRTHLHSLFQKTGVRRQTDIVGLLRGLAGPLA